MKSRSLSIVLALTMALLAGCPPARIGGPGVETAPAQKIEYAPLRKAYNDRVERIDQFWSRALVEINWTDEKDNKHYEQGDGTLIVRKPRELALAIGKLGEVMFWVGSDAERFWFFDLKPPENKPPRAAVGKHADIGKPGMPELPIPLPPDHLITLLGINALPESRADAPITATQETVGDQTFDLVTIPLYPARPALLEKIRIDTKTHYPVTITILDGNQILADAKLTDYQPIKIAGKAPGAFPDLAMNIELTLPARKARVKLLLSDAVDGKASNKVKDAQFNFETLTGRFNPNPVRILEPHK